ncbi:hypothetical protein C8R43DRAFT_1135563 [Mycena crocata]|nr:hypothetical protein C8R43DRAFT_1135563 [Mycena crocata]
MSMRRALHAGKETLGTMPPHVGMGPVCNLLFETERPDIMTWEAVHFVVHVDELIEGAGGSPNDLATLFVTHLKLACIDPQNWLPTLESVLVLLRNIQYKRLIPPAQFKFRRHLRQLRSLIMASVPDTSPMFEEWNIFADLATERIAVMDWFDSDAYTVPRACDNLECDVMREKTAFKRCGGCRRNYYCSETCQRADWYTGGHREACTRRCTTHCFNHMPERTCDRAFLRALANRDYLIRKSSILLAQVEFLVEANDPDAPFYVGIDYTEGQPTVHVHGWASGPGFWNIGEDDPCTEEQHARMRRSNGRYMVHRLALPTGGTLECPWIPLRTMNGILDEGVRRLARELEGPEDVVAKRAWLVEQIERPLGSCLKCTDR